MRRLPYILGTAGMLAITYTLLRFALIGAAGELGLFPDAWHFLDPFRLVADGGEAQWYAIGLHLALTAGLVVISILRAREAGWRPWIGALMILPVVRLFLFTALAVVPSTSHTSALDVPRQRWLDRVLPMSRMGSAIGAILLSLVLVLPLGFINVHILNDYGLALFIGLPFIMGATSSFLYNHHHTRSLVQSLGIAMLTVSLALLVIFVLAMEGFLCIAMAAPIVYVIALSGALVGHALSQRIPGGATAMTLMILLAPVSMAMTSFGPEELPQFKVVSRVTINATRQAVWNELVAFSRMAEPDELLFRAGISYPIEARISGTGVGAIRYCQFNTGPFVEPITVWNEPDLLAFDVLDDPPPLTELSIYDHIDAPHVDGFFRSQRGQFRLIDDANGTVILEGTTWYVHEIWPTWYWRLWSDAILHRIHWRVLGHIRDEAEAT